MIGINEKNNLPIKYNKKHATSLGTTKIDNEDINGIIKEVQRRDKFDKEFDIGVVSEY